MYLLVEVNSKGRVAQVFQIVEQEVICYARHTVPYVETLDIPSQPLETLVQLKESIETALEAGVDVFVSPTLEEYYNDLDMSDSHFWCMCSIIGAER